MKILFIGSVNFSAKALKRLIEIDAKICGVITKKKSSFNSDFEDLTPIANQYNIPSHYGINLNSQDSLDWIKGSSPDIIFCFGWSSLIKKEVLNIPPLGVVGFHPAALPQNRGRHPIIWALFLGLKETGSSFFFMDEGADSGDLLSQQKIPILEKETAGSLYQKITVTALQQISDFVPELIDKRYQRIPQDHSMANYWRKRTRSDGKVDFRMSNQAIDRLVRSLSSPYPGAHLVYKGEEIKVWQTLPEQSEYHNIEPGKILAISGDNILVQCSEGAIWLTEHEFSKRPKPGDYL